MSFGHIREILKIGLYELHSAADTEEAAIEVARAIHVTLPIGRGEQFKTRLLNELIDRFNIDMKAVGSRST